MGTEEMIDHDRPPALGGAAQFTPFQFELAQYCRVSTVISRIDGHLQVHLTTTFMQCSLATGGNETMSEKRMPTGIHDVSVSLQYGCIIQQWRWRRR